MELIEAGEPVAHTDVILTEILQGLRSERESRLVERHLRAFPILRLGGLGSGDTCPVPSTRAAGID